MRNALVVALLGGLALAACEKQVEQMGLTNWQKAPPLLAGVDEGAVVPAGPDESGWRTPHGRG